MRVVRLHHTRLVGAALGLFWVVAWAGSIAGRPHWHESFAQTSEAINSTAIVLWPLSLAIGSSMSVHATRTGAARYLETLPAGSAPRFLITGLLPTWFGALVGGGVCWLATGLIAGWSGSPIGTASLGGLIITSVGVLTCLSVGLAVGLAAPSYATPALLLVAQYIGPWQLAMNGIADPMAYTGVTAAVGDAMQLSWTTTCLYLVCLLALMTASWAVSWLLCGSRLLSRGTLTGVLATLVVGVGLTVTSAAVLQDRGRSEGLWVEQGEGAWECQRIGNDGSVGCLPRDLRSLQPTFISALGRVDSVLTSAIQGQKHPFLYSRSVSQLPMAGPSAHHVVIETDLDDPRARWAASVASELMSHPDLIGVSGTASGSPTGDCYSTSDALESYLHQIMVSGEGTPAELRSLVARAAACGHG